MFSSVFSSTRFSVLLSVPCSAVSLWLASFPLIAPVPSGSHKPGPVPAAVVSSRPSTVAPGVIPGGAGVSVDQIRAWLPTLEMAGIVAVVGLVLLVVVALVLRRKAPRVYWGIFGWPLLVWRMRRTWKRVALNTDLTATDRPTSGQLGGLIVKGRPILPVVPVLCRIWPRANGATAVIVMQPGQTPDLFVKAAVAMAHAWRVHTVRVLSDGTGRGRLNVRILYRDPLFTGSRKQRSAQMAREYNEPMDWQYPQPASLVVKVGTREDGADWILDLHLFPHWLITGATQSGKSTLLNAALWRWADRNIALIGIDCKGGMELGPHRPRLTALACDRHEAADLLTKLVTEAHRRMAVCREHDARNIWQLPADLRPVPIIVIVDELAELYLVAGREDKEPAQRATTNLLRLAQLGAALGIHLIIAGQRVGSDLGPGVTALRAQLAGRICLKVNDGETADMTLGDLYPDAVDAAQAIGANEKGVAITTDTHTGWIRARSEPLDPDFMRAAMHYLAKRTPTLHLP